MPDPYISNQAEISAQELEFFNELWRTGQDTLNDQFLFSVTSTVQWNNDGATIEFSMSQSSSETSLNDLELFRLFPGINGLCGDANANAAGAVVQFEESQ